MTRAILVLCILLLVVPAAGCGGPQKITRNADDWLQQGYVKKPWLYGNTVSWTLIFVGQIVTRFLDGMTVNPVDFWGLSAWPFGDGTGTPFHFRAVTVPAGR
jgi:hypothetical protein